MYLFLIYFFAEDDPLSSFEVLFCGPLKQVFDTNTYKPEKAPISSISLLPATRPGIVIYFSGSDGDDSRINHPSTDWERIASICANLTPDDHEDCKPPPKGHPMRYLAKMNNDYDIKRLARLVKTEY